MVYCNRHIIVKTTKKSISSQGALLCDFYILFVRNPMICFYEKVNGISRKTISFFCQKVHHSGYWIGKHIIAVYSVSRTDMAQRLLPSAHVYYNNGHIQWAISNNGFCSDSLYEKKIGEDLVFNNALPKSLTINTSRVSKGKTKIA